MERRLSDLPEEYAQLYDYRTEKFYTPLDSQGIVDVDKVFELALWTFPRPLPELNNKERNIHHLYWPQQEWTNYAQSLGNEDKMTVIKFRNGAPQKMYIPIPIHKHIEQSMIPPPRPSLEIMRRRNMAWAAASLLLSRANHLDSARKEYESKKSSLRKVSPPIDGITPLNRRPVTPPQYRTVRYVCNRDFLLDQLELRLASWEIALDTTSSAPLDDYIISQPRLFAVRALNNRLYSRRAFIPKMPDSIAA